MKILKDEKTGYYVDPNLLTKLLVEQNKKYKKNLKLIKKKDRNNISERRKAKTELSEELEDILWIIANKLINKENFINYWHIRDQMINKGFEHMYLYTCNYEKKKGSAFAYCTQICWNGYVQVIKEYKKIWAKEQHDREYALCHNNTIEYDQDDELESFDDE